MAAVQGVGGTKPGLTCTDAPWIGLGKGCNPAHSSDIPRKSANDQARSQTVRVVKVVHLCKVKSFRKAVSMVMDDLVTD